jgi:glycosyltransferase involved in cell wall biosynthesis
MIRDCLRSVLNLEHRNLRVLVIDQSDDDATSRAVEALAGRDPRLQIVRTVTVGVSHARNLAARHATTDVIAYVDDDCLVGPGWLGAILAEFKDPDVVAVFGRVVPPGFKTRRGTEVAFKPSTERVEYRRRVPPWYVGHGANMAIRRSSLQTVGGADPLLGAGGLFRAAEDLDLAYRLLAAGGRLVYTGHAVTYHKEWRDWKSRRMTERGYGIGAGAAFMKYVRCGDVYGIRLFATWIWELGVRRLCAGLLKWRSVRPTYLGYCQLVYPWIGVIRSFRASIDRQTMLYVESRPAADRSARPREASAR